MMSRAPHVAVTPRDQGLTLVEVLVAIGLFGVLGTILLGFALATSKVTDDTREFAELGEDARLGMERMTRELRQAERVASVSLPVTTADDTRFTVWVDFNGNRCIDAYAADPEEVTYIWTPSSQQLTVNAQIAESDGTKRPVSGVIAEASSFAVALNSSAWQYDVDQDGTTTASELDSSPIGDGNANVFTSAELAYVDVVHLSATIANSASSTSRAVDYSTVVDMRNRDREVEMLPCP